MGRVAGYIAGHVANITGKLFKNTIGKFLGFGRRNPIPIYKFTGSGRCGRRSMYGAGGKRGMRWGFKTCSKCRTRHRCSGRHRKGRRKGERKSKHKAFTAIRSLQQLARLKRLAKG